MAGEATVGDHNAFGHGLFRRRQQTLVKPNCMSACHFVEAISNFRCVKTAAQHLRCQQPYSTTDRSSGKNLLNHLAIVIDSYVKILPIKRYLPGLSLIHISEPTRLLSI